MDFVPSNPTRPATDGAIPAIPPGVTVTTLPNGLTIIVREDHSAPVVSAQAWCKAGSIHEGRWLGAGLSHVLEHMLFKGTSTRGAGRIDQEVQSAGGSMNAYTSFDRTVFYIDVPNTGAHLAVDILCDIMQHATLPAEELVKEMDVIRREMDMCQDDPGRRSSRMLFEAAYVRSPYRVTVIGYPDIFNELKREDIFDYYRAQYAANNVFFVVVGDLKTGEVVKQIEAAYAKTKTKALPSVVLPEEQIQTAPREVIEEAPIELGHLHLSWHIPELRHPDVTVLDVLATILGSGRSSRLYQEVREKQGVVHSVDSWTYSPGNPGLFGLSAAVDADQFEAARDAMLAEIDRVKREAPSADEVAKAVKQFTAGTLASRKTMSGLAQDLGGNWLAANDLNFSERYLAAVKRVTPGDLQRVACKYLTTENRTLVALLPEGTAPKKVAFTEDHCDHDIQKMILPNGLRLLVKEDHRLPFVEFRAVFQGGVLAETAENSGVTQLMGKLLLKGTHRRTAAQIAREIESVGGSIDSYGGNNSFGVNVEILREDFTLGLDLLADVLLNPTFPADALEREREVQLASIKAQRDHLLQSCSKLMRQALFGETGYGLDAIGSEESVARLRTNDLGSFHARLARPDNCVLAIYGDVKTVEVRLAVEQAFINWQPGGGQSGFPSGTTTFLPAKRVEELRDKKQGVIVIGFPGTGIFSPDRYALELISEACSDLGSRLFMRIRDEMGLAYYVGAQNFAGVLPGYFAFYCGTEGDKTDLVIGELLKEAQALCADGLTGEELQRSKAKIVGQKKISRQDLGSFALTTALDELYGLGYANADTEVVKIDAVTLEEVRRAAQQYLKADTCVIAVVKPEKA